MQVELPSRNFFSLLASLLVLTLLFSFSSVGYGSTGQDLNSINQKIKSNKQKIGQNDQSKTQLLSDIKQADSKMNAIQTRLDELQAQLNGTKAKMKTTQAELDRLQAELSQKQKELDAAFKELKRLALILNKRASNFYESSGISYLEVLLSAKSFPDLIHRADYLSRILNQDAQLLQQIKDVKATVESAKAVIEKNKTATEQKHVTLVAEENRIGSLASDQQAQKDSMTAQINGKKALFDSISSQNKQLASELDNEEGTAAQLSSILNAPPSRGAVIPVGSPSARGFIWPCNGPITSPWGISRPGHTHAGIDIGVGTGTPIVAVKSGVVSLTSYDAGGYGYYVDVDHGGVVSRYAHLSRTLVSAGQSVHQGQQIADSGATGDATGPHLHFEIRLDGDGYGFGGTDNPLKYLP